MSLQRQDLDKLLAPALVDGLGEVDLEEIRARRDACKHVEDLMSYLRRVVQGQIDLVNAEIEARAAGAGGDSGQLVEDLPTILAGRHQQPAGGRGGSGHAMAGFSDMLDDESDLNPEDIAAAISPELAATLFPGGSLPGANLSTFTDAELSELAEKLRRQEHELSAQRHVIHERIDQFQAVIVQRYKSGVADSDALLTGSGEAPRGEQP